MERDDAKRELELKEKLANCLKLAAEFPDGPTHKNIREMEADIRQQLRDLAG